MAKIIKFLSGYVLFVVLLASQLLWWVFADAERYWVGRQWKIPLSMTGGRFVLAGLSLLGALFTAFSIFLLISPILETVELTLNLLKWSAVINFAVASLRWEYTLLRIKKKIWSNPSDFQPGDDRSAQVLGWKSRDDFRNYQEWILGFYQAPEVELRSWKKSLQELHPSASTPLKETCSVQPMVAEFKEPIHLN
jgi:hypothetical protein